MKRRIAELDDRTAIDIILLRQRLGFGRYRKTVKRDKAKREILMDLGLAKIREQEESDYIPMGPRKRMLRIFR